MSQENQKHEKSKEEEEKFAIKLDPLKKKINLIQE